MKNLSIVALLTIYAAVAVAAPGPDATDTVELEARQLGFLFRGAAKAFRNAPEKAGKKVAKNMGQGTDNALNAQQLKAATNRWSKYLGKEQDAKCVQGFTNNFATNGGFGGNINCDKNPSGLLAGHKGGYYPSAAQMGMAPKPKAKSGPKSNGKRGSKPKAKSAPKPKGKGGKKKKREFLENDLEERKFSDDDLEGRDFVPVHLDLLKRETGSDFDLDERDLLDLDLKERGFAFDLDFEERGLLDLGLEERAFDFDFDFDERDLLVSDLDLEERDFITDFDLDDLE